MSTDPKYVGIINIRSLLFGRIYHNYCTIFFLEYFRFMSEEICAHSTSTHTHTDINRITDLECEHDEHVFVCEMRCNIFGRKVLAQVKLTKMDLLARRNSSDWLILFIRLYALMYDARNWVCDGRMWLYDGVHEASEVCEDKRNDFMLSTPTMFRIQIPVDCIHSTLAWLIGILAGITSEFAMKQQKAAAATTREMGTRMCHEQIQSFIFIMDHSTNPHTQTQTANGRLCTYGFWHIA